MTLTAQFNSKAKIDRREDADSEMFGGKNSSRFFGSIVLRRPHREEEPAVVVKSVNPPAPVLIRRGMNI